MQLSQCDAQLWALEQGQIGRVFRVDYVNSDELVKGDVELNYVKFSFKFLSYL